MMRRLSVLALFSLGCRCAPSEPAEPQGEERPHADAAAADATASSGSLVAFGVDAGPELIPFQPPPRTPFISHHEFPDCVHPGVEEDCNDGWCRIPAGCYIYGSPPDEPGRARYDEEQTRVTLTRDFEIQQTEVTQGDWLETGWPIPSAPEDVSISRCLATECPLNRTTWYRALRYANWLSEQRGLPPCFEVTDCEEAPAEWEATRDFTCDVALNAASIYECEGYRLPTSAEWEYAARAGTTTAYYSGPIQTDFPSIKDCNLDTNLTRVAWFCANVPERDTAERMEQPVAQLIPNGWGLYDTLGNAPEWVMDAYGGVAWVDPYLDPEAELDSPVQVSSGTVRSCHFFSTATGCRAAIKLPVPRASRWAGFRLARTLGPGTVPTLSDVPSGERTR